MFILLELALPKTRRHIQLAKSGLGRVPDALPRSALYECREFLLAKEGEGISIAHIALVTDYL